MILQLNSGKDIQIKAIDFKTGLMDYSRKNDPVYNGDCVMPLSGGKLDAVETAMQLLLQSPTITTKLDALKASETIEGKIDWRAKLDEKL